MRVAEFTSPGEFRAVADPLLLRDERLNILVLGTTGTLLADRDSHEGSHFWVAIDQDRPMATALRTPPHPILVSHADDGAGIRELAQTIARKDPEAPGVTGIEPGVTRFTDVWASLRAVRPHRLMRQGVYSIDHVAQDPEVEGAHRPARVGDFELLVDWAMAFHQETEPWSSAVTIDSVVRRRLETDDRLGGFWLWVVEGIPVCLSGYAGPTPNGIRIGPVYTPPDLRGHGYATALVTAQTHWLLKGGRKFCSLYTDLSNQVTNRIYRSIGFRLVGESAEYSFTSRQG